MTYNIYNGLQLIAQTQMGQNSEQHTEDKRERELSVQSAIMITSYYNIMKCQIEIHILCTSTVYSYTICGLDVLYITLSYANQIQHEHT